MNTATVTTRTLEGELRSRRAIAAFLRGDSTRDSFPVWVSPSQQDRGRLRPYEAAGREWYSDAATEHGESVGHVSGRTIADLELLDSARKASGGVLRLISYE